MEIDVRGAEGLALVATAVRRLGTDRTIVNEMAKEIRAAVPPVRKGFKANALAYLPRRGGLGAWVARAKVTARIRRSASNAGVTLVAGRNSQGGRTDMKRMDAGKTRHPMWGNRSAWAPQTVKAGVFTDAVTDEGAQAFREATVRAVDNAVVKVLG